jgi:DNA-binding NarL/FixJ family response regulator
MVCEEAFEGNGRLGGILFGEEVAAIDGATAYIIAPLAPNCEGTAGLPIPLAECPVAAPERQQRAANPAPGCSISLIVRAVECRRRAILLADGMDVRAIAQRLHICATDFR